MLSCLQLAVPVTPGGHEGVRLHGGSGGARPAGALRCGTQPPLRPHDHGRCRPTRAGASAHVLVACLNIHLPSAQYSALPCVSALGRHYDMPHMTCAGLIVHMM